MTAVATPPSTAIPHRTTRDQVLRQLSAITAAGLLLGFLVGGVGGRLAMGVLFRTSTAVKGIVTDDGFPIGQFTTSGTINLLLVTAGIGVIGTFVYAMVRPFLLGPRWLRTLGCAIGGGAVIGSMLVSPNGRDFTLLSPRWLAIALFVAIPAAFAALSVPVVERMLAPESWFQRGPKRLVLAPLLVFLFPPLFVLVGLPAMAAVGARHRLSRSPAWRERLRRPAVLWTVRAVFIALGLAGIFGLVQDVTQLL